MSYKIASIILNSTQNTNKSVSDIFISQPDANKEALAGKLFVIAEVNFNKSIALKIINFLINNINHNYYQNEKIILRERISSLKVEHIFESSLAKTNKDFFDFFEREKIKLNQSALNISIGVIHENNLYFSSIGKNKSFLIYKQKLPVKTSSKLRRENQNKEEFSYKITNIAGDDAKTILKQENNPEKIFSNVMSGQIPNNGYFFFSSEALPEYISNPQLIDIITKLPPAGAAEQIKNILSRVNAYVSFLGIIIKNTTGAYNPPVQAESGIAQSASAQNSVSVLNYTEQKTEKILMPSGILSFGKWLKIPLELAAGFFKKGPEKSKTLLIKEKIIFRKKSTYLSFKKALGFIIDIFFYIAGVFSLITKTIANKEKRQLFLSALNLKTRNFINFWTGILPWFKSLSRRNQIIIMLITICLFGIGANITATNLINKKQADQKMTAELKSDIEQKQNQIDAHLLYNNEEGASEILSELQQLIQQLPRKSQNEIDFFNKISAKNDLQLEKIGHVTKIENPKEIADFSKLNSQAESQNIIMAGNKIYSGDRKAQTIYSIDLKDNSATAIADLNQNLTQLDYPVAGENNAYFLNGNSLISINPQNDQLSTVSVDFPENTLVAGVAVFNNRFYFLDKKNNQIYRLNKSGDKLESIYNWLSKPAALDNAISLSIEGHAYVLLSNGSVKKFLKGELVDFSLQQIEPALDSPTELIASADSEFLYLLEPSQKRIAVFNKNGDFIMQYKSEKFGAIKDLMIDEKNKVAYILNGNSVLSFPVTHLEK